jgi:hypothetical protein
MRFVTPARTQTALLFFLLFPLLFLHCNTTKSTIQHHGFYYWESRFRMEQQDKAYLRKLDVSKLYIKFFDVVYQDKASPEGIISFNSAIPAGFDIIPVVFITNETIAKSDSLGIEDLAIKINNRLEMEIARTRIAKQVKELQIDCDWTQSTRNRYFYLLSLIGKVSPYRLSATIRLHQYKYNKNNIPPVDKGLLMCYNINDPTIFSVTNSLFDKEEVMKYIRNVRYPIPLDLAVPAFSWGVMFNSTRKFEGFTNSLKQKQVENGAALQKTERPNVFVCTAQTYIGNRYFSRGDFVRVEEASANDIKEIVAYLKGRLNQQDATLIMFHYDQLIKENEDPQSLYQIFQAGH